MKTVAWLLPLLIVGMAACSSDDSESSPAAGPSKGGTGGSNTGGTGGGGTGGSNTGGTGGGGTGG
ncbi:MAG TPA: hypothetical protein PKW66_05390, partial [Polyangiaceae bacterium]|nr:hypothetical protein [Polyangiaceae bacterium]